MKKQRILILFILLTLVSSLHSIPKPKSDNVGGIVGRLILQFNNQWGDIPAGSMYHNGIQVVLQNLDTGKKYTTTTNPKGYFTFLNIKPGHYTIDSYKKTITVLSANSRKNYVVSFPMQKFVSCEVKEKAIHVLNSLSIVFSQSTQINMMMTESPSIKNTTGMNSTTGCYVSEREIYEKGDLKSFFRKKIDRWDKWDEFTFDE